MCDSKSFLLNYWAKGKVTTIFSRELRLEIGGNKAVD